MTATPQGSTVPFVVHGEGSGVVQKLTAGEHVFHSDTYPAFGGSDSAPSPLVYVLGALISCNQVTASLVAKDLDIQLGRWTFDIQGDLNPAVLVGGAEGNANFDKVAVRATVETDATEEQFDTFVAETERRCPVSQLFARSGLEFANDWTRLPLPARV
jgi:uncharacterized OsmC-like protein